MLDDQKLHAFAILPDVTISAALAICLAAVSLYLVFGWQTAACSLHACCEGDATLDVRSVSPSKSARALSAYWLI